MVEQPHNFGYAEFIERYDCTVGPPKHINGMTVLHVVPQVVPNRESALDTTITGGDIFENGVYVVFSGEKIVGAKIDSGNHTLATIVDNGIKSYILDKPGTNRRLGVGINTMIWGGFGSFFLSAYRSFSPTSGNDVWVRYIHEDSLFVPFYVAFDNFVIQAHKEPIPFECEDRGNAYSLSIGSEN